jgi:uncharacterized membrane protein YfcA
MLVIAVLMLIKQAGKEEKSKPRRLNAGRALLAGLFVGGLTGFLGVGGGFLVVPALIFFGGLAMKGAVGTSLLVITINCAAGLLGHLHHGGFDLQIATLVTILATAGTLVGTALSHHIPPSDLRNWFALFVIAVALFLVVKNYAILL